MGYYERLYDIENNSIFRYKGKEEVIAVPPIIDDNYMIRIGKEAFARNKTVKKIRLATSYIEIGAMAFMGCSELEEIFIPDSVLTIGSFAFACCPKLTKVTMQKAPLGAGRNLFLGSPRQSKLVFFEDPMTEILDERALNEMLDYVG